MKRLIPHILLSFLLLLSACNRKENVIYSGLEAGTMDAGVFTSDSHTKMTVVGNEGNYDVRTSRRVLIRFETHPITDSDHIDIDLHGLLDAAIMPPEEVESLPQNPDGLPVQITDAWFSADYLNILLSFPGEDASPHTLSLAFTASQKGITLRLHHTGPADVTDTDKAISAFLSVPVADLRQAYEAQAISHGKKQADYPMPVLLQWTARTLEGGPLTIYEKKGAYSPPATN